MSPTSPPNETVSYDLARLDFTVLAGGALLLVGIMLTYIWRNWK
jgi:hypothetical protein